MLKNGSPSQIYVGQHVSSLYNRGYDFKQKANLTLEKPYKAGSDIRIMEHFVAGVELLQEKW